MGGFLTTVVAGVIVAAVGAIVAYYLGGVRERQKRAYESQKEEKKRHEEEKKEAQRRQEEAQAEAQRRQAELNERLPKAIEQLEATDDKGEKKLAIRLGGIHALERIDKESPERAYHGAIMEVLTAYVRQNAKWSPPELPDDRFTSDLDAVLEAIPDADIQAILNVFGRRDEDRVPEKHRVGLDLRNTALFRADLEGANFEGANFGGADLRGAFLFRATLLGANFLEADLRGAHFREADLREADLRGADLRDARFQDADLQGADFGGADLRGSVLRRATFLGANFLEANFGEADLRGAYLQDADLRGAIDLTQPQIEDALGNKDTRVPENLHEPATWSRSSEEQWAILTKRFTGGE